MVKQILCFLCVGAFSCCFRGNAQHTLSGTVRDAETGEPLDAAAAALVLKGGQTIAFSFSNEKGEFSVPLNISPDTLTLSVSLMGYAPFSERIGNRRVFSVQMVSSPIRLKEVTIRPGRIWGRSDTIRYDASRFLRENDKTVEDLMKRLPGIQVSDNGDIQYKGKAIGTMYVEGLDLMDGRYKSVSRNLSSQSVKEVEVLDNHQRIKSLAGKVPSDVADINIKLKDSFKDKWNFNPNVAAGFSADDFLYEAEANALQIARKSQSLYALKLSDTGNGITREADKGIDDMLALPDYRLLPSSTITAPLKERRWLFNDAAVATGNRLYRLGGDSRLKVNVFYTQDDIMQQTNSVTTYFNPEDTLTIEENKNSRLKSGQLHLSADYEDNASTHYLRNKLDFHFENNLVNTGISGSYKVAQRQSDKAIALLDNFSITRTSAGGNVFQLKSLVGYWRRRERLDFNRREQPLPLQGFYAHAESGWIIRQTKIAQHYTAGVSIDFNNLKTHHRLWATPAYEYLLRSLKFNLSIPLQTVLFPDNREPLFLRAIHFKTDYKINYAWNARLSAQYRKELNDITAFYRHSYFTDYRTVVKNETGIPTTVKQLYTLRAEYKNTLQEFFVTIDWLASHSRVNHTFEQSVEDNVFRWTRRYTPHVESAYAINTIVSKGFFDINTKVSLEASYGYNRSAQIRESELLPYSFHTLLLKPAFSLSPSHHTEIDYNGELQRNLSSFNHRALNGLWNMNHKVSFYYMQRRFDASVAGEYVRNEITRDNAVNLLFMDISASYKMDRITIQLQWKNVLNHRNYTYTSYNPLSVYSTQRSIRPREIVLTVKAAL